MEISQTDLAYAAGLIDGEGTITMIKKHASDKYRCSTVSMSSTTLELLVFMKERFNGCISNHKTYQSHHKKSYAWKVVNNDAIAALSLIVNYLREPEKLRRANLILSTYKSVTVRNGKYTPELTARKLQFEHEFFPS